MYYKSVNSSQVNWKNWYIFPVNDIMTFFLSLFKVIGKVHLKNKLDIGNQFLKIWLLRLPVLCLFFLIFTYWVLQNQKFFIESPQPHEVCRPSLVIKMKSHSLFCFIYIFIYEYIFQKFWIYLINWMLSKAVLIQKS